jgi:hypothetical protein
MGEGMLANGFGKAEQTWKKPIGMMANSNENGL